MLIKDVEEAIIVAQESILNEIRANKKRKRRTESLDTRQQVMA